MRTDPSTHVVLFESPSAIRTAKLEKIRVAVETGTYQVDIDALATRIVDEGVLTIVPPDDTSIS